MFSRLRDSDALFQILLGALTLQICVFCINGGPGRKATLTFSTLMNTLDGRRLEVGSIVPLLSVYNREGRGVALPKLTNNATLVFRSACNCEDAVVWNWVQVARRNKEPVALIAVVPPAQLTKVHSPEPTFQQIYSCRRADFDQIAPLSTGKLPYMVRIKNGKIASIETAGS